MKPPKIKPRQGPMKVIAVLGQKGGVGKTTVALNLAAAAARAGHRVALVDLDPQATLSHLVAVRPAVFKRRAVAEIVCVQADTPTLGAVLAEADRDGVAFVFIDLPPQASAGQALAIAQAHLVLMPMLASAPDLMTASTSGNLCRDARVPGLFVLNRRAPQSARIENEARRFLAELPPKSRHPVAEAALPQASAFSAAAGEGLGVVDFEEASWSAIHVRRLARELGLIPPSVATAGRRRAAAATTTTTTSHEGA